MGNGGIKGVMGQIFLKLTHQDWVDCFTKLNRIELGVLFYFRTLDPFGDRKIEIKCEAIAEVLDVHRTSVSRALKKLEAEGFIDLEITGAKVKLKKQDFTTVHPHTDCAPMHPDVHPRTKCVSTHENCASTHTDVHPCTNQTLEPAPGKDSEVSQTNKTYKDFIQTLSDSQREKFFSFVQEKIQDFSPAINDLQGWLASQNKAGQFRWQVYWELFERQIEADQSEDWRNHPEWSQALEVMAEMGHIPFVTQGGDGITLDRTQRLRLMQFARENGYLTGGQS